MEIIFIIVLIILIIALHGVQKELKKIKVLIKEPKFTKSDVQSIVEEFCRAYSIPLTDDKTNNIIKKYNLHN